MSETWRPVGGYEGIYEVSDHGGLRRVGRAKGARVGHRLRTAPDRNGYPHVNLCCENHNRRFAVHRLVAAAFLGPIPDGFEVNHIDGNPGNPHVDNLEIVTRRANVAHAWRTGLTNNHGERCSFAKLTAATVEAIRRERPRTAEDYRRLAALHHVSPNTVWRIATGRTWKVAA